MLTYNTLTALQPELARKEPEALADYVYDNIYAGKYPDRDAFRSEFMGNSAPLTRDDLVAVDPRLEAKDPDALFDYTMERFGNDPTSKEAQVARAIFKNEADERDFGDIIPDVAKSYESGSARMVAGLAWAGGKLAEGVLETNPALRGGARMLGITPQDADDAGQATADTLTEYSDRWQSEKSVPMQQRQALASERQNERKRQGDGLLTRMGGAAGDYLTDPALLSDALAASASYMVPGAGGAQAGAALSARVAAARGASEEVVRRAATRGGTGGVALSSGIMEGSDSALSAIEEVRGMEPEQLAQMSDLYNEYLQDGVDPTIAREMLAQEAGKRAFQVTAPISGGVSMLTARFESGVYTGKGSINSMTGIFIREPVEEFVQEGSNQFGINVGVGTTADPEREYFEGVPEAGAVGSVVGLGQAAGFKGLEAASDLFSGEYVQKNEALDTYNRAKKGESLNEDQIQLAKSVFPDLTDDFFEASRSTRDEEELQRAQEISIEDIESDPSYTQLDIDIDTDTANAPPPQQQGMFDPSGQPVESLTEPQQLGLLSPDPDVDPMVAPEGPRQELTNADVYGGLRARVDQGAKVSQPEQWFIEQYDSGVIAPETTFSAGRLAPAPDRNPGRPISREADADSITRGVQRELAEAYVRAESPPESAPVASTEPESRGPTPGVKQGYTQPRAKTFKTRKSADLSAQQQRGTWETYQNDAGQWQIRPKLTPDPAPAPPLESPRQVTPPRRAEQASLFDEEGSTTPESAPEPRQREMFEETPPDPQSAPEGPRQELTNTEVYEDLKARQDATEELSEPERWYVERFEAGDVTPEASFSAGRVVPRPGDNPGRPVSRAMPLERRQNAVQRELAEAYSRSRAPQNVQQAAETEPESRGPTPGVSQSYTQPRKTTFRTRKSADLSAQQQRGTWESFKNDDGKWQIRPVFSQPAAEVEVDTEIDTGTPAQGEMFDTAAPEGSSQAVETPPVEAAADSSQAVEETDSAQPAQAELDFDAEPEAAPEAQAEEAPTLQKLQAGHYRYNGHRILKDGTIWQIKPEGANEFTAFADTLTEAKQRVDAFVDAGQPVSMNTLPTETPEAAPEASADPNVPRATAATTRIRRPQATQRYGVDKGGTELSFDNGQKAFVWKEENYNNWTLTFSQDQGRPDVTLTGNTLAEALSEVEEMLAEGRINDDMTTGTMGLLMSDTAQGQREPVDGVAPNSLGLYSRLEWAVRNMGDDQGWKPSKRNPQGRSPGKQILDGIIRKAGVKAEEIRATGIEDYLLMDPDARFTREEVLEYVQGNAVYVTVTESENIADPENTAGPESFADEMGWGDQEYDEMASDAEVIESMIDRVKEFWMDPDANVRFKTEVFRMHDFNLQGEHPVDTMEDVFDDLSAELNRLEEVVVSNRYKKEVTTLLEMMEEYDENRNDDSYDENALAGDAMGLLIEVSSSLALKDFWRTRAVEPQLLALTEDEVNDAIEEIVEQEYMDGGSWTMRSYSAPLQIDYDFETGLYSVYDNEDSYGKEVSTGHESVEDAMASAENYASNNGMMKGTDSTSTRFFEPNYNVNWDYSNYRELKLKLPDAKTEFTESMHFPYDSNIVTFMRVYDKALANPDGESVKTFVLAEQQSDWHQQGRNIGYDSETIPPFKNENWVNLGLKHALLEAVADPTYQQVVWPDSDSHVKVWNESYRTLYENQYDKLMPKLMNKLMAQMKVDQQVIHVKSEDTADGNGYFSLQLTPELRSALEQQPMWLFRDQQRQENPDAGTAASAVGSPRPTGAVKVEGVKRLSKNPVTAKALATGRLKLVSKGELDQLIKSDRRWSTLNKNSTIYGAYNRATNEAVLLVDNFENSSDFVPVALHELLHEAQDYAEQSRSERMEMLFGRGRQAMVRRLDQLERYGNPREREILKQARALFDASSASRMPDSADRDNERLSYTLQAISQMRDEMPRTLKQWFQDLIESMMSALRSAMRVPVGPTTMSLNDFARYADFALNARLEPEAPSPAEAGINREALERVGADMAPTTDPVQMSDRLEEQEPFSNDRLEYAASEQGKADLMNAEAPKIAPVTVANDLSLMERVIATTPGLLWMAGRRQLAEIAPKELPSVKNYLRDAEQMDADRTEMLSKAGELISDWHRWGRQKANQPMARKLYDVMHRTTVAGYDPSQPYTPLITRKEHMTQKTRLRKQQQAETDTDKKKRLGERIKELDELLVEEVQRAKAKPMIDMQWKQLSPEAKQFYTDVRDSYEKSRKRVYAELKNRINRTNSSENVRRGLIDQLRKSFESQAVRGPYFPLSRFGDFWTTVHEKNPDGTAGELMEYRHFDSRKEANDYQKAMKKQGYLARTGSKVKEDFGWTHVDPNFAATVTSLINEGGPGNRAENVELADQVWQLYLQTLPEMSVRKQFIHRKKTPGWNDDALRAFAHLAMHNAHHVAKMRYGDKMALHIDQAKEELKTMENSQYGDRIVAALTQANEWAMNPTNSTWAQNLTSIGFVGYLSVSPAAAAVNMIQTPMVALPIMGAEFGFTKASAELARASKEFGGVVGNNLKTRAQLKTAFLDQTQKKHYGDVLKGDEQRAFNELVNRGRFDKTMSHDLAGVAEEGLDRNMNLRRWLDYAAATFHNAEVYNREVTGIATYRLARAKGMNHEDAVDRASEVIQDSHFDYSNSARARILQAPVAKVLGQFKQFALNMSWRLLRDAYVATGGSDVDPATRKQVQRQALGMWATSAFFAGATGIPIWSGVNLIAEMLNMVFGDDDEPFEFENEVRSGLVEMFGKDSDMPDIIMAGPIDALTGAAVGQRVSPDIWRLWIQDSGRELTAEETYREGLFGLLGPVVGGTASMIAKGWDLGQQDEWGRALEQMTPKFARDILKATRYAREGVTNLRGDTVVPKGELSNYELMVQAIGFVPADVMKQYDRNRYVMNYKKFRDDRKKRIMDDMWKLVQAKEPIPDSIIERIGRFNKANPAWAITSDTVNDSMKSRMDISERSLSGVDIPNVEQRLQLLEDVKF